MDIGLLFALVLSYPVPDTGSFLPVDNGIINVWNFGLTPAKGDDDGGFKCEDCLQIVKQNGNMDACFTDFNAQTITQTGSLLSKQIWSTYNNKFPAPDELMELHKDDVYPYDNYCAYGDVNSITSDGIVFKLYNTTAEPNGYTPNCDLSSPIMYNGEHYGVKISESMCIDGTMMIQFKNEPTNTCSVIYERDYGDDCGDPQRRPVDDFETIPLGKCLTYANWYDFDGEQNWQWSSTKMDGDKNQGLIQYSYLDKDCQNLNKQEGCAIANGLCQNNLVKVGTFWSDRVVTIFDPTNCVATTNALSGDKTCNVEDPDPTQAPSSNSNKMWWILILVLGLCACICGGIFIVICRRRMIADKSNLLVNNNYAELRM